MVRRPLAARRAVATLLIVAVAASLAVVGVATAGAEPALRTTVTTTNSWAGGYCAAAAITNTSSAPVEWRVGFSIDGTVYDSWNATVSQTGATVTAHGNAAWNRVIQPGATYSAFGFCAQGSAPSTSSTTTQAPSTTVPGSTTTILVDPTPGTALEAPLSTRGADIVDRDGDVVVLRGVNWFGFETSTQLAHGLWTRDYRDMLGQIAALGYDTIRLPFSLQAMRSSSPVSVTTSNGANGALVGKRPIEALEVIVAEARTQGLVVLLDNHSLGNDAYTEDLWFNSTYSEDQWVQLWRDMASRFGDDPNVVGADLKNEPHGAAEWGTGSANDWRRAAERAGAAVQAIAPHWLVVVEGVQGPVPGQQLASHWWGGNLEAAGAFPVRLPVAGRLVYSPHEYGPSVHDQPWFALSPSAMAQELERRWTIGFGYLVDRDVAPVLVGEFGGKTIADLSTTEGRWFDQFADYLAAKGISWTFWSWNPNSSDTGGLLTNDWRSIDAAKHARLVELMSGSGGGPVTTTSAPGSTTTVRPTTTTTAPSTTTTAPSTTTTVRPTTTTTVRPTTTTAPSGVVSATVAVTDDWGSGYCARVSVRNASAATVVWQASFSIQGRLTGSWNARVSQSGSTVTASGDGAWNRTISPGGSYEQFGFCAAR
jgi:endoglucanase